MTTAVAIAVVVCSAYLVFTTAVYVTLSVIGGFESIMRGHERG
jgi:hypothetical protein